jgi:hypothetical protein
MTKEQFIALVSKVHHQLAIEAPTREDRALWENATLHAFNLALAEGVDKETLFEYITW